MKIKGLIIGFIACSLLNLSCKKQLESNSFRISGTIEQAKEVKIVLSIMSPEGLNVIDTITTDKEGKFSKDFPFKEQAIYMLADSDNDYITIIPQAKEDIVIQGEYTLLASTYSIKNSPESQKLKELNENSILCRQKLKVLNDTWHYNKYDVNAKELHAKIKEQYIALEQQERQYCLEFIDKNSGSLACIIALYRTFDGNWLFKAEEIDVYEKVLSGLKKTLPENSQTLALEKLINQKKELLTPKADESK
jgi:hypothetical protein